jgi:crotonobetainyl-CoA:carnitine CoA-transferase CaiB-like acyl-CoA transferase
VLRAKQPGLISVSISGFHPDGPGAARKAYDLLMQAESGLADITGSPHAPGRVGVSLVDIATGMFAYEAILEALLERATSGRGRHIDVALFDAAAQWLAVPYLLERYGGAAPQRVGLAHPGICPYGVFITGDEKQFVLSIQNEREWERLCRIGLDEVALFEDPRCKSNESRVEHRTFVDGRLQAAFTKFTFAEIRKRLDQADLAFAPVNSIADLKQHGDLRTVNVQVGSEQIELPRLPGSHNEARSERDQDVRATVPELGQHTAQVLEWLAE